MNLKSFNLVIFIVGLFGLVLLLFGLIFQALDKKEYLLVSIPLTGIASSILATSISSWLFNKKFGEFPIDSVVEALAESSKFIRNDQELQLLFNIESGKVKVTKVHKYNLINPSKFKVKRSISMFADTPLKTKESKVEGGFSLVKEPENKVLRGNELDAHLSEKNGKVYFSKEYSLKSGINRFEFDSYDYYRLDDRLVWVVQDRSIDFNVRITNNTAILGKIEVKINHHRENEIHSTIERNVLEGIEYVNFSFNHELIPFQGFEIMWSFSNDSSISCTDK